MPFFYVQAVPYSEGSDDSASDVEIQERPQLVPLEVRFNA